MESVYPYVNRRYAVHIRDVRADEFRETDMTEQDRDSAVDLDQIPPIAYIETDRFCDHCGYNLRTQAVRRDERTKLLLCRCPECGRLLAAQDGPTAGRIWLQRLGTLALFFWIMFILSAIFGLGAAQVGLSIGTLEELTTYQASSSPQAATSQPAATQRVIYSQGSTTIIQTLGSSSNVTRVPRQDYEGEILFRALVHASSFVLGYVLLLLLVVVCHHWRKWTFLLPAVAIPGILTYIGFLVWTFDYPELADWSLRILLGLNAAFLAGCLAGIVSGRPVTRTMVRLLLPPRLRQVLAFLWLADAKTLPRGEP